MDSSVLDVDPWRSVQKGSAAIRWIRAYWMWTRGGLYRMAQLL
jgi:hypothetical protein